MQRRRSLPVRINKSPQGNLRAESRHAKWKLDNYLKIKGLGKYKQFLEEYRQEIETGPHLFDPNKMLTYFSENIPANKSALATLLPIFIASLIRNTTEVMPRSSTLAIEEKDALPKLTDGYEIATSREYADVVSHGARTPHSNAPSSSKSRSVRRTPASRSHALKPATDKAKLSLDDIRKDFARKAAQRVAQESKLQETESAGRGGQDLSLKLPVVKARKLRGRSSGAGFGIEYLNPTRPPYFGGSAEKQPTYLGGLGSEVCVLSGGSPSEAGNDFVAFSIQGNAVKISDSQWLLGKYIFTQNGCANITVTQDSCYDDRGAPLRPPTLAVISGNLDVDKERADNRFGITFGQDVASPALGLGPFRPPIDLGYSLGGYITKPVIIPLDSKDGRFGIMSFNSAAASFGGNYFAPALNLFSTYTRNGAAIGTANLGRGYPDRPEQLLLILDPDAQTRALFVADGCRIYSIDKYGNFAMGGYIDQSGSFFADGIDLRYVQTNGSAVCFADSSSKPSLAKYDNGQYYFLFKDALNNIVKHVPIYSNGHFMRSSFVMGSPPGKAVISQASDRVTLSTGDVVLVDTTTPSPKVYLQQVATSDSADQPTAYFVDGVQDARSTPTQRVVFPFPEPDASSPLLNLSEIGDNSLTYISGYFSHGSIALPLSASSPRDVIYGTIAEVDFPISGLPFSVDSLVQKVREQKPISAGLQTYAVAVFPGNKVLIFPKIENKSHLKAIIESSSSFIFNPVVTRRTTSKTSSPLVTKEVSVCAGVTITKTITITPSPSKTGSTTVTVTKTSSPSGTITKTETTTSSRTGSTTVTVTQTPSPSGTITKTETTTSSRTGSTTVTVTRTPSPSGTITTTSTTTKSTTITSSGTGSKTITTSRTISSSKTPSKYIKTTTSTVTPSKSGESFVTRSKSVTRTLDGTVISSKTKTTSTTKTATGLKSITVANKPKGNKNNKTATIVGSVMGSAAGTFIATYLAYLWHKKRRRKASQAAIVPLAAESGLAEGNDNFGDPVYQGNAAAEMTGFDLTVEDKEIDPTGATAPPKQRRTTPMISHSRRGSDPSDIDTDSLRSKSPNMKNPDNPGGWDVFTVMQTDMVGVDDIDADLYPAAFALGNKLPPLFPSTRQHGGSLDGHDPDEQLQGGIMMEAAEGSTDPTAEKEGAALSAPNKRTLYDDIAESKSATPTLASLSGNKVRLVPIGPSKKSGQHGGFLVGNLETTDLLDNRAEDLTRLTAPVASKGLVKTGIAAPPSASSVVSDVNEDASTLSFLPTADATSVRIDDQREKTMSRIFGKEDDSDAADIANDEDHSGVAAPPFTASEGLDNIVSPPMASAIKIKAGAKATPFSPNTEVITRGNGIHKLSDEEVVATEKKATPDEAKFFIKVKKPLSKGDEELSKVVGTAWSLTDFDSNNNHGR